MFAKGDPHKGRDAISASMTRYYVDCREVPSQVNCTVSIAADDQEELEQAALHHMTNVHGHEESPKLRDEIRTTMHQGQPPG